MLEECDIERGQFHREPRTIGLGPGAICIHREHRCSVEIARGLGAIDIMLRGDSTLVVNQALGRSKCRSALLQPYLDAFTVQATHFTRLRLRHIKRSKNLAGIALDQRRR